MKRRAESPQQRTQGRCTRIAIYARLLNEPLECVSQDGLNVSTLKAKKIACDGVLFSAYNLLVALLRLSCASC